MCSSDGSPVAAVERLMSALDELRVAPVEPGLLPRLIAQGHRLEAVIAGWTREADERRAWQAAGASSAAAWLAEAARVAPQDTDRRVRNDRALDELPAVAADVARGRVSGEHVSILSGATRDLSADERAALEPLLLEAARRTDPRSFAREAREIVASASADAGLLDAQRQRTRREASLWRQRDGMFRFSAQLTAEDGHLLQGKLSAIALADRQTTDERSPAQKTYDAFAQLLRAADAGASPRARILVTTTLEQLAAADAEPGSPAGRLGGTDPIVRAQLDRIACFAEVRRIVLDASGVEIDLGRSRRTVTDAQFDALVARWGGCAGEGCDRPASWCEAHHVIPWQYGGVTSVENLVLFCTREHHRLHDLQLTIRLKDGRSVGPHGWVDTGSAAGPLGWVDAGSAAPAGPEADPPTTTGPPGAPDESAAEVLAAALPGFEFASAPPQSEQPGDPPHRRAA